MSESTDRSLLHSTSVGEGPPVVLLHGLFGSGGNLGALARSLADQFRVFQLDLPNHGRSDWIADMSISSLAETIAQFLPSEVEGPVTLVGHSLGGKVAMQLALAHPQMVRALVIADIAPVAYSPSHDAVFAGIAAVSAAVVNNRREAAELLSGYIVEEGVIQFLLLSLAREQGAGYRWRFNAEALQRNYPNLLLAPEKATWHGPTFFLFGADSSYLSPSAEQAVREYFPAAKIDKIEGTGHWLHAEKPEQFNLLVKEFLTTQLEGAAHD
ncbi:MAG: alpha/beta fold hydrolase [Pseudomonadota bacterium]